MAMPSTRAAMNGSMGAVDQFSENVDDGAPDSDHRTEDVWLIGMSASRHRQCLNVSSREGGSRQRRATASGYLLASALRAIMATLASGQPKSRLPRARLPETKRRGSAPALAVDGRDSRRSTRGVAQRGQSTAVRRCTRPTGTLVVASLWAKFASRKNFRLISMYYWQPLAVRAVRSEPVSGIFPVLQGKNRELSRASRELSSA